MPPTAPPAASPSVRPERAEARAFHERDQHAPSTSDHRNPDLQWPLQRLRDRLAGPDAGGYAPMCGRLCGIIAARALPATHEAGQRG